MSQLILYLKFVLFPPIFAEKTIVLNMLRMAATGEINPNPQQQPHSYTRNRIDEEVEAPAYVTNSHSSDGKGDRYLQDANEFEWSSSDLPFKLPEHDTIIHRSHSRLSSLQSGVHSSGSFHQRLQKELDQHANVLSSRLCTPYSKTRQLPPFLAQPLAQTSWKDTDLPLHIITQDLGAGVPEPLGASLGSHSRQLHLLPYESKWLRRL